jgi:molecular chaperone Hsp33
VERAIISIGKKDIQEMIDDGKPVEVRCQFCDKIYNFDANDLKEMLKQSKDKKED